MSLQTDAETIRDLAHKIVKAEILRAKIIAEGGVIFLDDEGDMPVTLTTAQKQAALSVEAGWQTTIKSITAGW